MFTATVLLALAVPASSTPVLRLEVHASSQGLDGVPSGPGSEALPRPKPKPFNLVITCDPQRCVSDNERVPVELVEAFRIAATAPSLDHIDLENLGMNPVWIRKVVDEERASVERAYPTLGPTLGAYDAALRDCATRADVARAVVIRYFDPATWWTDDYPRVEVVMTLQSGATIKVSSTRQQELMLPWTLTTDGRTWVTYDARVSRALGALLSSDFLERDRIVGKNLAYWYVHEFLNKPPGACPTPAETR